MLLERYEFNSEKPYKQYDFYSEGPKGRIRKVVLYSFLGRKEGNDYYNLGFGDYDERKSKINDLVVSDKFDIQGLTEKNGWGAFQAGDNYLALLASRK